MKLNDSLMLLCRDKFLQHQSLWCESREEVLNCFLSSGNDSGKQPSLTEFKEKVHSFVDFDDDPMDLFFDLD